MKRMEAEKLFADLVEGTRQQTPVPFIERDAERVLAAIQTAAVFWEVVRLSNVPMRFLCDFCNQLINGDLVVASDGKLSLTDKGKELVEALEIAPVQEGICNACEGRGIDISKFYGSLIEKYSEICKDRPEAIQDYDQGYVTEATSLASVSYAWQRGDLENKEIIILGDDDLKSIAAALTGAPKRVLALDIDTRLIEFINKVAEREGLKNLKAVWHDLREPLREEWLKSFDTFMCDPPESIVGLKAFVERGIMCLKGRGCAGYFGLTHVEASLSKWAKVQKFLLEKGAVITDLREDFSSYVNWDYIKEMRSWSWLPTKALPEHLWYCSAFHRIELLKDVEVENPRLGENIFDDEEVATN
ncbi:MAG: bis-aminopropyl spermidine synthase family protein [Clostridia bacterium]|nr:bis-aminopropyl spermidine synthase family protein [Clostridia bacterium]